LTVSYALSVVRLRRLSVMLLWPLLAGCGLTESDKQPESERPVEEPLDVVDEITLSGAYPKVAMDDYGSGVVVWTDGPRVHALRYDAQSGWGAPEVVFESQGAAPLVSPATLDIRDGRVLLTFVEWPDILTPLGESRLFVNWGWLSGSWEAPQALDGTIELGSGKFPHSVAASIGANQSALVSWLWGADVEMSGWVRDLRYASYEKGNWSAPVGRQVQGAPPWRPALMSADALGPSTFAIGADTEVASVRCEDEGTCSPGPSLPFDSPPGYMPTLAMGANRELVALLTAPMTGEVSVTRLERDATSWDLPIQTEFAAGVSLTLHAEAAALATWKVSHPNAPDCGWQLSASQYRSYTGVGPTFIVQPSANGVFDHDAASAPNGIALVAWSGGEATSAASCTSDLTFSIRRIAFDGSMSQVLPLGPVPVLPDYATFETTLAVSSDGSGMYGWTDGSFSHGTTLPTLRIVVVD
jgi:hypothetical protein